MRETLAFPALFFDGKTLAAQAVFLEVGGGTARLIADAGVTDFPLAALRVSPRVGHAQRFIALPGGAELVCPDDATLDVFPAASPSEGVVAWLERRVWVAVLSVLSTIVDVTLFYFYGLPRVADLVAERVPMARERGFGKSTLALFDQRMTEPTRLHEATLTAVREGFAELKKGLPPGMDVELEFRYSRSIGPNAFALPGGIVVVTDQMLETCSNDETLVILAHELGHVEHRHALRSVLQELGVSALAGVLSTDASSLSMSATALPFVLASAHYSQAFERDADADGFRLARQAGWSPELFASCLQKISEDFGDERRAMTYTSSHPPSLERIQAAQHAAAGFKPWRGLETDAPADAADADEPADAGDAGEPDAE